MLFAVVLCCSIIWLPFSPSMDAVSSRVAAYAGDNVTIPCHYESSVIMADWIFYPFGSTVEIEICLNGFCLNDFSRRFSVHRKENFILVIQGVMSSDRGTYVCVASDESTDYRHTTELNVTERQISNTNGDNNTTSSSNLPDGLWFALSAIAGLIIGSCIGFSFGFIVRSRSRKCRRRHLATPDPTMIELTDDVHVAVIQNKSWKGKVDHKEENETSQTEPTVENLHVSVEDACILVKASLMRFRRKFVIIRDAKSAAVESFKTLALVSSLWWNGLKRRNQRMRRLMYPFYMMRFPSYIVADSDGRLLVADFSNNRILLLHPKLEHGCAILNHRRDGIATPHRLCLDEVNSELLVVQWPSHLIQRLSLSKLSAYNNTKLKDCIGYKTSNCTA